MKYSIKRNNSIIASIHPEGQLQTSIMGEELVAMAFSLGQYIRFQTGDSVEVYGNIFYLASEPQVEKISTREFRYSLEFQGVKYELSKVQYLFPDKDNVLNLSEFYIMGTARQMLDLLIQNANRIGAGWSLGNIDTTETKQLHFSAENCLSVLSKIAQEFHLEYWVDANKSIHLTERKVVSGYSFEYGKSKGLISLTRETQQGSNIVTRLYAFGSEKNIAGNYRNGQKQLRMAVPFLEKNTNVYGIIEASQTFDVYPHRIGKVTAVNPDNPLQFTDNQLDFDLNEKENGNHKYLINGVPLKVTFNTGQLAGYTFEVKEFGYHSATKTFTLLKNTDEKAMEVPSETLRPAVGDTYVLTDLIMPQKYIANAEAQLQRKAQTYLNENSRERVIYRLVTDPIYFKEQNVNLQLGSTILVKDTDFNLEENLRIIRLVKDLQNPYKVQVEVAERMEIAHIVRQYLEEEKAQTALLQADKFNAQMARKAYRFGREIHNNIFDGEGYFNTEKIKPLSIDTKHISVGSRMQQFALPDVMISVENATTIKNTRGKIVHLSLEETPREWHIATNTQTGISAGFHYIYIKAQRNGNNASVLVSSEKIAVESDPNFYHFEAGYLGSVENGNRRIRLSHGFTQISPHEITTGVIAPPTGNHHIELLQDRINIVGDVTFSSQSPALLQVKTALSPDFLSLEQRVNLHTSNAVNSLQIGGRNLLLKSNEVHSNDNYNLCRYIITEDIEIGEEITLSYEGDLAPSGILVLFNGSGDGNRGYIMIYPNEKQKTIKWSNNYSAKIYKGTEMYVYIQGYPVANQRLPVSSTIRKIKLEKGNKATDWTPAPEDISAQITASETALKAYADAQDLLQKTLIEAHADGKISQAEQRQINLAEQKLQEAKTHADNQIQTAKNQLQTTIDLKQNALKRIEIDLTALDTEKYFPVVSNPIGSTVKRTFRVEMDLYYGVHNVSWSMHPSRSFSLVCQWITNGHGWGTIYVRRIVELFDFGWCDRSPIIHLSQAGNSSQEIFHLRGGAKYVILTDPDVNVTLEPSGWQSPYQGFFPPIEYDATKVPKSFDDDIRANWQKALTLEAEQRNIQAVTQLLQEKTDFVSQTKINGNTIATGVLAVGNSQGANAFINGTGLLPTEERIAIGANSFEQRSQAPFRVLANGTLYATNAHISGEINATSGRIGDGRFGITIENDGNVKIGAFNEGENKGESLLISKDRISIKKDVRNIFGMDTITTTIDGQGIFTLGSIKRTHFSSLKIGNATYEECYTGAAYYNTIYDNIKLTHTFIFTSAPSHHQRVALPSLSQIRSIAGRDVSIKIEIIVAHACHQRIRIQGQNGGFLLDNNANRTNGGLGYIDMERGDTLTLRSYGEDYYIMNHRR